MQKSGLWDTLNGEGSFTVFAPRNVAFFDFDDSQISQEKLKEILESLIVPGEIRFEAMKEGANDYMSVAGSGITVVKQGNLAI